MATVRRGADHLLAGASTWRTRGGLIVWIACSALACNTSGGTTTESTASSSGGSETGDTDVTETETDACQMSSECETDDVCVAPYVLDPEPGPGGSRGPASCVPPASCIAVPNDIQSWCFDHQGCCGDLRCRTADGVCEEQLVDTTTSGTTSDTTSDATDTDTDSEAGTDSETETDSETDAETDAETETETDTTG